MFGTNCMVCFLLEVSEKTHYGKGARCVSIIRCVCVCVCVCVIHVSHQEVYLELRTDVAGRYHVNLVSNTLSSYQRVQSVRNITGRNREKRQQTNLYDTMSNN